MNTRFCLRALAISSLLAAPLATRPAEAQAGRFDLEKTKTVLTGLINKAITGLFAYL